MIITASEKQVVVRTRDFGAVPVNELVARLKSERFTGNMTVNFAQGGVCSIRAEDRAAITHLTEGNNSL